MTFTRNEKAALQAFIDTPGWDVLVRHLEKQRDEMALEPVTGDTEFSTLKNLHIKEGKIEILKALLEDIERDAQ